MFGSIARRYDLLNHLLSGNVDRLWRNRCVREVGKRIPVPGPRILDVGCGTGDLSLAFAELGPVVGCDFCHPMLVVGSEKIADARKWRHVSLLEGDALLLPFEDHAFDAVVSAFLLRNLVSTEKGLAEMYRVLRRGGVVAILDFAMPTAPVLGSLYRAYFRRVLPRIGKWVSGVDGPYNYLPESVEEFPSPPKIAEMVNGVGFDPCEVIRLTGGIAVLYVATRPSSP